MHPYNSNTTQNGSSALATVYGNREKSLQNANLSLSMSLGHISAIEADQLQEYSFIAVEEGSLNTIEAGKLKIIGGVTTFEEGKVLARFNKGNFKALAHEIRHQYGFLMGEISFGPNGKSTGLLTDFTDEEQGKLFEIPFTDSEQYDRYREQNFSNTKEIYNSFLNRPSPLSVRTKTRDVLIANSLTRMLDNPIFIPYLDKTYGEFIKAINKKLKSLGSNKLDIVHPKFD